MSYNSFYETVSIDLVKGMEQVGWKMAADEWWLNRLGTDGS